MAWQEYVYELDSKAQLHRLSLGRDVWNRWRQDNPMIFVDLSHAKLSGADFSGYNLHRAYLSGIDLSHANLSGADLSRAELVKATMTGADLTGANLSEARLRGALLMKTNLIGANLTGAYLSYANFAEASGTSQEQLTGARLFITTLPDGSLTRFLWDGRLWTPVNWGNGTVTLLPEQGEPLQVSLGLFTHLLHHTHIIDILYPEAGTKPQAEVQALLSEASKAAMLKANERFLLVSAYLAERTKQLDQAQVSERTIQRWVSAFQAAQLRYGVGFVGLLPRARKT